MKAITLGSFFVLFAIVGGLTVPTAFAEMTATVSAPVGSGNQTPEGPNCQDTNECYIPATITIDVGGEVTWTNDDTLAHTVTSGTPGDSESVGALFDSSIFMGGLTWSHTFNDLGEFPYFCMIHPWMEGMVIVGAMGGEEVTVTITDSASDDGVQVDLEFNQMHVNYDITATQDGNVVWEETGQHAHTDMMGSHMIPVAASDDNPIDIKIVSLGIGISEPFTGTTGEVASKQIVPEFGTTIAMMILGVAIVSIIALSAKSRVILKI